LGRGAKKIGDVVDHNKKREKGSKKMRSGTKNILRRGRKKVRKRQKKRVRRGRQPSNEGRKKNAEILEGASFVPKKRKKGKKKRRSPQTRTEVDCRSCFVKSGGGGCRTRGNR